MTNDIWKYAAVSVASAAAGSGITFLVVNQRLKKRYDKIAKEEIKSVKESYKLLRKEGKYADPATAVRAYEGREQELHEAVEAARFAALYQAESDVEEATEVLEEKIEVAEEVEEAVLEDEPSPLIRPEAFVGDQRVHNIFDNDTVEVEIEPEINRARPYLIPEQVFMDEDEDEQKYSKITLTYWAGDSTLCDDRETIIPDIEKLIGAENLEKFGSSETESSQNDVIYVRNEKMKADYEVVREDESYGKVVLGFREEEDDRRPKVLKMRGYHE